MLALGAFLAFASSSSFVIAGFSEKEAGPYPCAALSSDGRIVVYRGLDRIEVRQSSRRVRTGRSARSRYGACLCLSEDARLLAYDGPEGLVVEETLSGKRLAEAQLRGHGPVGTAPHPAEALAFSPNGRTLAVAYGTLYHHWLAMIDLPSGAVRTTALDDFDGGTFCLAWSPDSRLLAGGNPVAFVLRRDGSTVLRPSLNGDPHGAPKEDGVRTIVGYGPFFRKGQPFAGDGHGVFPLASNTDRSSVALGTFRGPLVAPDGSWAVRPTDDGHVELFRPAERAFDVAARPQTRFSTGGGRAIVGGGGSWLLLPHGADFYAIDLRR